MGKPGERGFLQERQEVMRSLPRFSSLRRHALTTSVVKPRELGFLQELQEVMPSLPRFSSLRRHALTTSILKPGERGFLAGASRSDDIITISAERASKAGGGESGTGRVPLLRA